MKNLKIYPLYFLLLPLFFGCDKPAPTELINDSDKLEIEVISQDTGDEFYSSGFDTTGIIYRPSVFANTVTISGVKITTHGITVKSELAQAVFFDKGMPVYSSDGRLLGYRTRLAGSVEFNNVPAALRPYVIRFRNRNSGNLGADTLGLRYILYNRQGSPGEDFNYSYGSNVNFRLTPFSGLPFTIDIPTPSEITGSVRVEGSRSRNNLKAALSWNSMNTGSVEVIISVRNRGSVFPLFRIRVEDDGKLEIPGRLLNQIPLERFEKLVFSIVRKIEIQHQGNPEIYILSQSIHSLVVDIP
jgi:hypothetical protein